MNRKKPLATFLLFFLVLNTSVSFAQKHPRTQHPCIHFGAINHSLTHKDPSHQSPFHYSHLCHTCSELSQKDLPQRLQAAGTQSLLHHKIWFLEKLLEDDKRTARVLYHADEGRRAEILGRIQYLESEIAILRSEDANTYPSHGFSAQTPSFIEYVQRLSLLLEVNLADLSIKDCDLPVISLTLKEAEHPILSLNLSDNALTPMPFARFLESVFTSSSNQLLSLSCKKAPLALDHKNAESCLRVLAKAFEHRNCHLTYLNLSHTPFLPRSKEPQSFLKSVDQLGTTLAQAPLYYLNLSHCKLSEFPESFFRNLFRSQSLRVIDLRGNLFSPEKMEHIQTLNQERPGKPLTLFFDE